MYYPCSENKGADQLRSYCEADLRLCFRIGKNPFFSWRGSILTMGSIVTFATNQREMNVLTDIMFVAFREISLLLSRLFHRNIRQR